MILGSDPIEILNVARWALSIAVGRRAFSPLKKF
jgi:hypothetical protein